MSEHTKEPWEIWETIDSDGDHWISVSTPGIKTIRRMVAHITLKSESDQEDIANARRIVACVNACAGIPDSVLEEAAKCANSGRFGTMAALYKAQRDELLAALQMALADHMTEPYLHPLRDGTVEAIRCAIANAEERGLDAGDKSL